MIGAVLIATMYLSIALVDAQPLFLVSGLAVYDNAMPCNNLTLDITNLNTGMVIGGKPYTRYNFSQLVGGCYSSMLKTKAQTP